MTKASPLVSVILPVYNAESTVEMAISSALAGTHQNLEIVVCDDASSDRTLDVVRSISDPRIKVLKNDRNLGPGISRDKAIDASNGKWITFLDADDEWTPERLAALLEASEGDHDLLVFDDIMLCHHTSRGLIPWRRVHGKRAFGAEPNRAVDLTPACWAESTQFVMQPLLSTSTLRALGVRHSGRRFQEDTEFFLRLMSGGLRLRYLSRAAYRYRITPGSLSSISKPGWRTREMLEDVIPLFLHDARMKAALEKKVRYRTLTSALRMSDFLAAWRIAVKEPSLALELFNRGGVIMWYEISRSLHGGIRR